MPTSAHDSDILIFACSYLINVHVNAWLWYIWQLCWVIVYIFAWSYLINVHVNAWLWYIWQLCWVIVYIFMLTREADPTCAQRSYCTYSHKRWQSSWQQRQRYTNTESLYWLGITELPLSCSELNCGGHQLDMIVEFQDVIVRFVRVLLVVVRHVIILMPRVLVYNDC